MFVGTTSLDFVDLVTSVISDTMMSFVLRRIVMFLNVKRDTQKFALSIKILEGVNLQHTVDITMKSNKM